MIEGMQERIRAIRKLERLAAVEREYRTAADKARSKKEAGVKETAGVLSVREAAEATGLSPARIQQIRGGAR